MANGKQYLVGMIGGAALIALVAFWPIIETYSDAHEGLAVWVQAILTVVALGIAIAAPIYAQRIAQKTERQRILGVVAGILASGSKILKGATDDFDTQLRAENYLRSDFDQEIWQQTINALESIKPESLTGFVSVRSVLAAAVTLQRAMQLFKNMRRDLVIDNNMNGYEVVKNDLGVFTNSMTEIVTIIEECRERGEDF